MSDAPFFFSRRYARAGKQLAAHGDRFRARSAHCRFNYPWDAHARDPARHCDDRPIVGLARNALAYAVLATGITALSVAYDRLGTGRQRPRTLKMACRL